MKIEDIPQKKRQRCEVWTRVMGYHRPVDGFNPGKQAEFRERKCFKEKNEQLDTALQNT